MEVLTKQPSVKGPDELFTGDVWFDVIAKGQEPSRMRVNAVHFAPCSRTAWHTHAVGQTLDVTEGIGYVQAPAVGPETIWGDHVTDDEYPAIEHKEQPHA